MNVRVTLDRNGRVVIPKPLRDHLRLEPGDTLELEPAGEGVTMRPARSTTPLTKERGVWVFRTGKKLPVDVTDRTLRGVRAERDRQGRGSAR
jgi:AbrB family looped-hinge helix DNA binding protein